MDRIDNKHIKGSYQFISRKFIAVTENQEDQTKVIVVDSLTNNVIKRYTFKQIDNLFNN